MNVGSIILAAGRSRRMGFPKSLLDIRGRASVCVLAETLRTILTARAQIVIVTNPADAPKLHLLEALGQDTRVQIVVNPHPESGRTGSLQLGLHSLAPETDAVWIWPVDTPCVQSATLQILSQSLSGLGRSARIVPTTLVPSDGTSGPNATVHQRGGHPILIGAEWWSQIYGMGRDQPLRDLFTTEGKDVLRVDVADPAILWNLDTPLEVERRLGTPARVIQVS